MALRGGARSCSADLLETLGAWAIPAPRTLRPSGGGLNNLSRFVDTPAGSYFLRVYQNTDDIGRVRYEHALLSQLRQAGLSFAVPLPLATRGGETFAVMANDGIVALFPVIAGQPPEYGNVSHAEACGEALGELDGALTCVEVDSRLPALGTFGDLHHVSPLVPDPLAMVRELPIGFEEKVRLRGLFEELFALVPGLYERSPRQIVHSDYFGGNVLMERDRVSGILDFEFASPDLRVMDFAVGLYAFGVSVALNGGEWSSIEAFARGYRKKIEPTPAEIEALPILLLLREATSLVHWTGRFRRGLTSREDIAQRSAGSMLALDGWLRENGEQLIRSVAKSTR